MERRRDVFQAIADPTRREIIHLISGKALNVNAIARHFDTSRPTISEHVKLLVECGLITIQKQGRERVCEAKLEKLAEVHQWTEQYQVFWMKKLHALKEFLEEETVELKKTNVKRKSKSLKKLKR